MRTREQMLSVHPTPSSLTVSMAPFGNVILAVRPDKCSCAEAMFSLLVEGPVAPCEANVPATSRTTAIELVRMIEIFMDDSPLAFVDCGLDCRLILALHAKTDVSCGNSTGTVDNESSRYGITVQVSNTFVSSHNPMIKPILFDVRPDRTPAVFI